MTITPHPTMHGDHRQWENEISLWRDDLRVWQHDVAGAMEQMEALKTALEEHALALKKHASSLRLEEEDFGRHEQAIVKFEKEGEGEELFGMAARHTVEGRHHLDHQNAHEAMKRRHHNILARFRAFAKAVQQPPAATGRSRRGGS